MNYKWSDLNKLQLGKYAEYFAKMELTVYGCDVYSTEVDDRGIDFVVRKDSQHYYDIQVKSIRPKSNYVYMPKDKFEIRENMFLCLVLFRDDEKPSFYLIPASAWKELNQLFVSRDYDKPGQKSKPEWGLNLSKVNLSLLKPYEFDKVVDLLVARKDKNDL